MSTFESASNDPRIHDTRQFSANARALILPDGSKPVPLGSGIITGMLGEGGMAFVYEIWNEQLGVKRAIKMLRPNNSFDNHERFDREVKITAQLDHPNIIKIHGVGKWNGLPYIEMEVIDGHSLEEILQRKKNLPLPIITSIGIIVSRALHYTHSHEYTIQEEKCKGLLHRDLKPANILISHNGVIRLTDFGVATPTNLANTTSSGGKIIGSMQYLAPEQLDDSQLTAKVDIFSFGCILYEMLTGYKTFPEANMTKLVRQRLKNTFKSLSSYNVKTIPALEKMITQCLSLQPEKRPESAGYLQNKLEEIHNSITTKSPEEIIRAFVNNEEIDYQPPKVKKSKSPVKKIFFTIAALAAAVGLGYGAYTFNEQRKSKTDEYKYSISFNIEDPINTFNIPDAEEQSSQGNGNSTSKLKNTKKVGLSASEKMRLNKPIRSYPSKKSSTNKSSKPSTTKKSKPSTPTTHLEKLQQQYGVSNPLEIMKREGEQSRHQSVIALYNELPKQLASTTEARLLRHRALMGTAQITQSYFDNNHINDGEYYLSKAQHLYNIKKYQRSLWVLDMIEKAPVAFMNKSVLNKQVLYYKAKNHTGIFLENPKHNKYAKQKTAMTHWYEVKKAYKNNQKHPHFIEANKQIRIINNTKIE